MNRFKKKAVVAVMAPLMAAGAIAPSQAGAFSASSSITASGVTYTAKAYSCNLYLTSCSWNVEAIMSKPKSYTHYGDVKANGISVKVTISADPSATISGNSTTLATARETGYGTYNKISGQANPSIFSVSVASRSRLVAGGQSVSTGWTTW